MLFELAFDRGVRVYVRVEDVKTLRAEADDCGEREMRTPWTHAPGQLDSLRVRERKAAQNCDARVALLAYVHALLEVEPPLPALRPFVARRPHVRAHEVHFERAR